MTTDFSDLNIQYLVSARDLVRQHPDLGAVLLGFSNELAQMLAAVQPRELQRIALVKPPLFVPRNESGGGRGYCAPYAKGTAARSRRSWTMRA